MKLSVRSKVANGLVICLLLPRAAETASELVDEYSEGLNEFTAQDEFDLTVGKKAFDQVTLNADPADDPSGGDPSGGDPSGGDPTGCPDPGRDPSGGGVVLNDPSGGMVTAEDGSEDRFEVYMEEMPSLTRFLQFISLDPDEVRTEPSSVTFSPADACVPRSVRVIGQNDGIVDGTQLFEIEVRDEFDDYLGSVGGENLDNDDNSSAIVEVFGPNSLQPGFRGTFTIRVSNIGNKELKKHELRVETTDGLAMTGWVATLLSGEKLKAKGKLKDNEFKLSKVELPGGDVLLLTVHADLELGSAGDQTLSARFMRKAGKDESDDNLTVRNAVL